MKLKRRKRHFFSHKFLQVEGEVARSVTEAITVLSDDGPAIDLHPEKRLEAAYRVTNFF